MLNSIIRFNTRLSLPNHLEFKLESAIENNNKKLFTKFIENYQKDKPILELYHSSRFGKTATSRIMKNVFDVNSAAGQFGNKGPGIYLSKS